MTTLDRLVQAQADNASTDIYNFHSWDTTVLWMGGSSGWRSYVRFATVIYNLKLLVLSYILSILLFPLLN